MIDRGMSKPAARNAPSRADRGMLPEGGRLQGSPSKSASLSLRRLAQQFVNAATNTTRSRSSTTEFKS